MYNGLQSVTMFLFSFLPSPVQCTGLGHYVACLCVSQYVTIFLHILLLTLNYHSPPLYAGIFILLKPLKSKHWRRDQLEHCRRNSLGTSHSRHGCESEWPAVSSKRLESVESHSTGLETKSSCGLDCENSSSTGLVYK